MVAPYCGHPQAFVSMTQPRMSVSAAAIGQFIYITGGNSIGAVYEQPRFLERWSTVRNMTRLWDSEVPRQSQTCPRTAWAMGSQLVVVGGITKAPWRPIVHIQTEPNLVMFCDPKGHRRGFRHRTCHFRGTKAEVTSGRLWLWSCLFVLGNFSLLFSHRANLNARPDLH